MLSLLKSLSRGSMRPSMSMDMKKEHGTRDSSLPQSFKMSVQVTLVASACLLVNLLALSTVLRSLRKHSASPNPKLPFESRSELGKLQYEDEDGVATSESISALGNGIPRFLIATGAISGLAMSIFCAVEGMFNGQEMDGDGNLFPLKLISVVGWV